MRCRLTLAALVALSPLVSPAAADRLTADICEQLRAEQDKLGGARADMQRGPEWAKVNLSADRLARIRRLMEVEEQITFRCQRPQLASPAEASPHAPAAAPEAEQPRKRKKAQKAKAEAQPPADGKAEPAAQAADAAKPAPKATATPATGEEQPAPKKAKSAKRTNPSGEAAAAPADGEPATKPAVQAQ